MTRLGVQVLGDPGTPWVAGWRELLIREGLPYSIAPQASGEYPVTVAAGAAPPSLPGDGECQILDGQNPGEGTGPFMAVQRMLADGMMIRVHGIARAPAPPWVPDPVAPVLAPFAEESPLATGHRISSRYLCGPQILLPMPLGLQLSWVGSAFCSYEHASLLPAATQADEYETERLELPLALIDRNRVCRLMADTLRLAFARCGLPYVRLWYYPSPQRCALLARFDVDVLDEQRLEEIGRRTQAHGRRGTFFINLSGEEETEDGPLATHGVGAHGAGHQYAQYAPGTAPVTERPVKRPQVLRSLAADGHELASHGYRHTVFTATARCREDIAHSLDLLRQLGADVHGYAAPGGIWQPAIEHALESLGLEYSSENSRAFEGFPFWTGTSGSSGPLQIPVSPFLKCGLTRLESAQDLVRTWGAYCDDCSRHAEPASFTLHTQDFEHMSLDVYDALLAEAGRRGLLDLTFTEFARWWRVRADLHLAAMWDGTKLDVQLSDPVPIEINGLIHLLDSEGVPRPVPPEPMYQQGPAT